MTGCFFYQEKSLKIKNKIFSKRTCVPLNFKLIRLKTVSDMSKDSI